MLKRHCLNGKYVIIPHGTIYLTVVTIGLIVPWSAPPVVFFLLIFDVTGLGSCCHVVAIFMIEKISPAAIVHISRDSFHEDVALPCCGLHGWHKMWKTSRFRWGRRGSRWSGFLLNRGVVRVCSGFSSGDVFGGRRLFVRGLLFLITRGGGGPPAFAASTCVLLSLFTLLVSFQFSNRCRLLLLHASSPLCVIFVGV